jgi:perosamine synthetase
VTPIPVNQPDLDEVDRDSVIACLESGWISSEGPAVAEFEAAFAEICGRSHGIAVSSGTAGLDIAVRAAGIGPGDEVLVPSLTIISCGQAIVNAGAKPVPVDCDPDDWNAHLDNFRERASPKTRAIMLVHLYGSCGDLDPILSWAHDAGLTVIEDASQALGLSYDGRPCGSFGDVSVFSLYANKVVTTGEGGMIVCDSDAVARECRSLRNLCFQTEKRFWHEKLGWNYRMSAMQAALGIPQLRRLARLIERKRAMGTEYHGALERYESVRCAPVRTAYADNVFWAFGLVLTSSANFDRAELMSFLDSHEIGTRTFFYGLHEQPALLAPGFVDPVSLPVTESLSARGLYLPSGLGLSQDDQREVIDVLQAFLEARA